MVHATSDFCEYCSCLPPYHSSYYTPMRNRKNQEESEYELDEEVLEDMYNQELA